MFSAFPGLAHAQTCEATGGGRCFYIATTGVDELTPTSDCLQAPSLVNCSVGGTFSSPWKSAQKAAACAQPGDVIYLRGGTYDNSCTTYPAGDKLAYFSLHNGSQGNPITLKSYPGESATLIKSVFLINVNGGQGDYHVIEGLEFSGASLHVYSRHDVVRNNHMHGASGWCDNNIAGLKIQNDAGDILAEGNTIHDNFDHSYSTYTYWNLPGFLQNCSGVKVMHRVSTFTFRNNIVYNEPAGIHLKYPGEGWNITIASNTFYDFVDGVYGAMNNYSIVGNVFYDTAQHSYHSVFIGSCVDASTCGGFNVTVASNTMADTGGIYLRTGNPRIYGNIMAKATSPLQINVYDGIYGGGQGYPNFDLNTVSLHDNCYLTKDASGTDTDNCSTPYAARSVYFYGHSGCGNYYYTLPQAQAQFNQDQNSLWADPLFVDPQNGNYHLRAGSPCSAMGAYAATGAPPSRPRGLRLQ